MPRQARLDDWWGPVVRGRKILRQVAVRKFGAVFAEISRIPPDVRVILSIDYGQQETTRRFAGQGLSGFIQKPYTMGNLRDTLRLVVPNKGEQIVK
ncbi:MAG: hypothetical protein WCO26_04905 [Deltaproteobacteria bacterium]